MGTPRHRPICSWDPPPQRHGCTLHGLGATALRASAASHHACGREELLLCWADSETRPQGPARATLLKDRKVGPLAGLSRPGQPRRQPDASRSTVPAVPSLNWARAHETGSRTSRAGRRPVIGGSTQVGHLHPAGRYRPRGTSLERPSGWIRTTDGLHARKAGPAPTAFAYQPRRKATRMGATGTQYRHGVPTRVAPAVSVNLPAGQASGGPRGERAGLPLQCKNEE